MRSRATLRGLLAALIVPVLFAGAAHGQPLLRCARDQVARQACCCPMRASHAGGESAVRAPVAACCCEVERSRGASVPTPTTTTNAAASMAVAVALAVETVMPERPRQAVRPLRSTRERALGPPLFVLTQSFLI